ncbi:MAG: diguanylate cyclase [Spirochaetota bacterium]
MSELKKYTFVDFFKKVDIFSLLDTQEINLIIGYLKPLDIARNEVLFKEGDEGSELYIVERGRMCITINLSDGQQKQLREFTPGDFFGEMSIFENAPRSATCYAQDQSRLFSLHKKDFYRLIQEAPSTAIKIMYRMSSATTQRLRNTSEFLSDMVLWGQKARKRAITDRLTGVYNRHFLDNSLEEFFKTAKRKNEPLSVVMVDLDYFRTINDHYGHHTGDRIILEVVNVFKKYLREKDIIARYGGDEFTVVMPDTCQKEAALLAEKICREVNSTEALHLDGPVKHISTSQGIASYPDNADNLTMLRQKADQALYKSKQDGRNRVTIADQH